MTTNRGQTLFFRSVLAALLTRTNATLLSVAIALAAALWNPLPLILWTLGTAGWLFQKAGSRELVERVLSTEHDARFAEAEERRRGARVALSLSLASPPLARAVRAGEVPDYAAVYDRLAALRERLAARCAAAGEGLAGVVVERASLLLDSYLELAAIRLACTLAVSSHETGEDGTASLGGIAEVSARLERLEAIEETDPEAAETRARHAGLLRRRLETLEEWRRREGLAAARLELIPDVLEELVARVEAPAPGDGESADLEDVLSRADETAGLVESLRDARVRTEVSRHAVRS